jgi:hypothetical protein
MNEKPEPSLLIAFVLLFIAPQVLLGFATLGTALLDQPSPVSRLTSQTTEKSVKWTKNELKDKDAPKRKKTKKNETKIYSR